MSRSTPELVFVHGLAKKPRPEKLEELWLWGLDVDNPKPEVFGYDNAGIGTASKVRVRVAYWADVFYVDYETDLQSYYERGDHPERVEGLERTSGDADDLPPPRSAEEQAFVDQMMERFAGGDIAPGETRAAQPAPTPFELVPLPAFVKKRILKQFAVEAFYFLYEKPFTRSDGARAEMRAALRRKLLDELKAARARSDVVVIVSHSMGTMIAYDCLQNADDCPDDIAGLITLGSPLGVDEIQGPLIPDGREGDAFPSHLKGPWINVYDPLDPICALDPRLANDFPKKGLPVVRDIEESNWGDWRHTITHYLAGPKLRAAVRELARL